MINSDGYIKLIDMGTSKFIDKNQQRTFTIIGTPHYMATDVLSGKGYSKYCDIWSFGICFF
jgi:cGMP-dependent protein kinase